MKRETLIQSTSAATKFLCAGALLTTGAYMAQGQTDYAPAIWRPCCNANWYTSGYGHKFCVVHDMEGYYMTTVSFMTSCSHTSSSVYYAINGLTDSSDGGALPGEITQMVRESNYAWHACCWNQYAFGCEHEGFASNPAWYTEAMYQASSGLYRHWCDGNGIPKDRNHIVAHGEKSNANWVAWAPGNLGINATCNSHTDPGSYWDWNHYMGLITGAVTSPNAALVRNSNGALEIFDLGTDTAQWHNWQGGANGGWQTSWGSLGMAYLCQNVATKNADGRQQLFALGMNNSAYSCWMQTSGAWSGWLNMGGTVTCIAVGTNADGRIELFGVGTDTALWHNYQTAVNGNFSGWSSLGGAFIKSSGSLAVDNSANGCLQVFAVTGDNVVHLIAQTAPNGGWGSWTSLGGTITSEISVTKNSDGRLEVFGVGADTALWHCWQTAANGGWSAFSSLGGGFFSNKVVVSKNADGRLQVFALNVLGVVYSYYQAVGGGWSSLLNMGGAGYRSIACGINADGRMELFCRGDEGFLWHCWQGSPNGGWSGWANLSTSTFE